MRSVKSLFVAAATALVSTAAVAADMPSIAPPPGPYPQAYPQPAYPQPYPQQYAQPSMIEDFGGWYLRGDIGMSNQKVRSLFNVLYNSPGTGVTTVNHFDDNRAVPFETEEGVLSSGHTKLGAFIGDDVVIGARNVLAPGTWVRSGTRQEDLISVRTIL